METLATFWWYYPSRTQYVQKLIAAVFFLFVIVGMIWSSGIQWLPNLIFVWIGATCCALCGTEFQLNWRHKLETRLTSSKTAPLLLGMIGLEILTLVVYTCAIPRYLIEALLDQNNKKLVTNVDSSSTKLKRRHKHATTLDEPSGDKKRSGVKEKRLGRHNSPSSTLGRNTNNKNHDHRH